MFSGLSALVIEEVADDGEVIRVAARSRDVPSPCPVCGVLTGKVHGYHGRTMADVPVDGRKVVVHVQVRRLVCPVLECRRQTFREQAPGLMERLQRRTNRLTSQVSAVVKELCGRAAARLSRSLAVPMSFATALRLLRRIPIPVVRTPRVVGVDDFALRRRHRYATIIIDAETGERIDVLPGREAAGLEAWLLEHPGVETVLLLECSRRLDLALNTVKRYSRIPEPPADRIAPRYRTTLVDPYREHLRIRRATEPAVAVTQLFHEIKAQGYTGSHNLLVRYLTQGRAEGNRPVITPRHAARLLLTHPEHLWTKDTALLATLTSACPETAELAKFVGTFAQLLTPEKGNDARLTEWIADVRAADLPHLHSFCNGLELDRAAVNAGLTLPHHNGRTEGVNTRTKRIMRQMHGRAGFDLLRHRILLS
ncbi:transposase [Streptomyces microflavus]|uniref:transposase n=1 Tax=Streptomyces microflavus TaxID=1919 RepID=UPI0038204E8C